MLTTEQKQEIEQNPLYFVMEGGSDGTFGNSEFHSLYGHWGHEAMDYAAKL